MSGIGLCLSVRPSSLRRWSLSLLVGFIHLYNHTYSESLWWGLLKNQKRTQIQRQGQRQRQRKDKDTDKVPETLGICAIFLKSRWLTHSKYDYRYLTLVILFTPITLVILLQSYNQFYRADCITISVFFFLLIFVWYFLGRISKTLTKVQLAHFLLELWSGNAYFAPWKCIWNISTQIKWGASLIFSSEIFVCG